MAEQKPVVLLAEDDPAMTKLLTAEFERSGFDVAAVADGEAVLPRFSEVKPDIVLLDLILPHKNGIEALRELRGSPEGKAVPVAVLSNVEEAAYVAEAEELGAKAYIIKADTTPPEVVAKVKAILGR